MDNQGSPLTNLFRALPSLELVLFVWSGEAFAFALRHVRGSVEAAQEECPLQSVAGKWALTSPYSSSKPSGGHAKGLARSLMGAGPYWVIVNMSCYVTEKSPLDLFTEAAVSIRDTGITKVVSANTPEYALQQLRQYRGHLPPSVEWLSTTLLPPPVAGLPNSEEWWTRLLEGTKVDPDWIAVIHEDFDPDFWYLPGVREPQESLFN